MDNQHSDTLLVCPGEVITNDPGFMRQNNNLYTFTHASVEVTEPI